MWGVMSRFFAVQAGVAGGDGLLLKHIQSRAGETVMVQGGQKGGLVDGAAAAHVDHIGGLRQQGEARRGEKPLRLTGGGQGQGQDIRIRQEGVQLVVGMDLVKGGVGGLFGAADTADSGGARTLARRANSVPISPVPTMVMVLPIMERMGSTRPQRPAAWSAQ